MFGEISNEQYEDVAGEEENWAMKASRLRRCNALVKTWYRDRGLEASNPVGWDVEAAAKSGDETAIAAAVELILGTAVQCEAKAEYVGRIMQLPEDQQATLMRVVDRVLRSVKTTISPRKGRAMSEEFGEEDLRADLAAATRQIAKLQDQVTSLEKKRTPLEDDDDSEDEEASSSAAKQVVEFKAQAKEARDALERASRKLRDLELEVDVLRRDRDVIESKRSTLAAKCKHLEDKVKHLEDEVDLGRDRQDQLRRYEDQIDKLKRRIDDASRLKKENKDLDAQNQQYLKEIVQLEASKAKAERDTRDSEATRDSLESKTEELFALRRQLQIKEADLTRAKDDLDAANEARRFFEDELDALRNSSQPQHHERDDDDPIALNDDDTKGRMSALRSRVAELERENAKLNVATTTDRYKDLEKVIAQRESQVLDATRHIADLQAENDRLQTAIDASSDAAVPRPPAPPREPSSSSSDVARLQAALRDKDATITKMTDDRSTMELHTKKTLANVQEKYAVLVQTYKNQIKEKQDRISHLESRLRSDRTNHKREEALVVSAIYDLGQRLMDANLAEKHHSSSSSSSK